MRLVALLSLSLVACAAARVPAHPSLDPDKPVRIERDGYTQDGHDVNPVELDARLLEVPDARAHLARSYRSRHSAYLLCVLAFGFYGYAGGVLSQDAGSRSALGWGSAGAGTAAMLGWLYLTRSSVAEHHAAVEAYNTYLARPAAVFDPESTGSAPPRRVLVTFGGSF